MATTIKTLEERIDEFSADVYHRLDSIEARLDRFETKFDKFLEKYDDHRNEFIDFRGRADESFRLMRWVFGCAAAMTLVVISSAYYAGSSVAALRKDVEYQQKSIDEIKAQVKELITKRT